MASTASTASTARAATGTEPGDLVARACGAATTLVSALGLAVELALHEAWAGSPPRLLELFSLSAESNVPTWWASLLAAGCALELGRVARARLASGAPYARHFATLAAGFAFISMDEVAQLHEDLGLLVEGEGVFYFGWVKGALVLVALLGLAFVPFLRALAAPLRRRFLLAGALYVGGAVGMELPLGAWTEAHGSENLVYSLLDWVEESLELVALTFFLGTLRAHAVSLREREG